VPGEWVETGNFRGSKSFGFFMCPGAFGGRKCQKIWRSAHAFPAYEQGCKGCEAYSIPVLMWQNDRNRSDDWHRHGGRVENDDEKAPHDSARCEACRTGVCTGKR
jgi:hypothetical protein